MRYLCHAVLHDGRVYRQSLVRLVEEEVEIRRFDSEIHSTVFVSGLIAVVAQNRVTDADIGQLKRIVSNAPLIETAILRAMNYLKNRNLFVADGEIPRLIIMQR